MTNLVDQIEIVKKSKSALFHLSVRSIILYFLQIVSRIVLAKNLIAEDFGVFGILQGWIGSLMFFTDIGLGDILSRKSGKISNQDFASYFFIRLFLSVVVSVLFVAIYPLLKAHYGFNFSYSNFTFVIFIFLVLDVLAACPMMLMGHRMEFTKVAKIEVLGLLVTYVIQIGTSFFIHNPWTFFIGLFFGKIFSVVMSFYYSDKIPFPKYDKHFFNNNVLQGMLFQLATILPTLQVIILPYLMSMYFNTQSIGLVFWIEGLVTIPLALIFNYNRVAFISLSKFAEEKDRLRDIISRFFMIMCLGICLVFGLGAVLSKSIIHLIFGAKWSEAALYIHFSCIAFGVYSLRFLGLSVLSAINRPKIRLLNEMLLVVLTASLFALFGNVYGMYGYFYAMILSYSICLIFMLYSIRAYIHKSVYRRMFSSVSAMLIAIFTIFKMQLTDLNIVLILINYLVLFGGVALFLDLSIKDEIKKYYNVLVEKLR